MIKKQTFEKWYKGFGMKPITPMQIMSVVCPPDELMARGLSPHGVYTALGKQLTEMIETEIDLNGQTLVIKGVVIDGSQHYQLLPLEIDPIQISLFGVTSNPILDKLYPVSHPVYWICEHPQHGRFRTNNLQAFCAEFNIQSSLMSMVARGVRKQTQGWICQHE